MASRRTSASASRSATSVKVNGKPVRLRIVPPPPRIIAYHKPAGEIVTHDDPQHRPTVFRRLPRLQQGKWQSVGRLDINTEGLLLFTNSGGLANQLMHPRFGVEREYAVRVLGSLTTRRAKSCSPASTSTASAPRSRRSRTAAAKALNQWYRVVITEGRNREVRKLFDAVGLTVSRLIRIRYGTVVLPHGLKRGVWVDLDENDVRAIRRLGLRRQRAARRAARRRRAERGGIRKQRNDRQRGRQRTNAQPEAPRRPTTGPSAADARPSAKRTRDYDRDFDADLPPDPTTIPNPLEQTFDKRFVQSPRHRPADAASRAAAAASAPAAAGPGGAEGAGAEAARSAADVGRLHRRRCVPSQEPRRSRRRRTGGGGGGGGFGGGGGAVAAAGGGGGAVAAARPLTPHAGHRRGAAVQSKALPRRSAGQTWRLNAPSRSSSPTPSPRT